MAIETRRRLPPAVFDLPVEKMRDGYYSDAYFTFTKEVLERRGDHPQVLVQVFQRHRSVLGGMDEAIAILRECAGRRRPDGSWESGWDQLVVQALHDGDDISPWEAVMTIEGDYSLFCHLETVYLGALARRTLISRNVREVVEAANGKAILYFPARHDHHRVQTGDGYAAHVAGAIGVSTDAQASWWGGRGMGTVPHGLIAAYHGNTVRAAEAFAEAFGDRMDIVVLVDFENDSVRTALEVARALGDRLWGVRLDTSNTLVDLTLAREMTLEHTWRQIREGVQEPGGTLPVGRFDPRGVNEHLVWHVREALDAEGFRHVRIVVSGGFTAEKIRAFEAAGVPVDAYGVGSALIRGENDFTADVVRCDGEPAAKVGRSELPNPRLELVR
jgi:nicotinate phosphoribosyltransferase